MDLSDADCFSFLRDAATRELRTVLVTISGIVGTASRSLGTHFAVSEDGRWHGSLSGGCIEAAVAAEALRVLERGRAETVRFGSGSPFVDIRLPCGGGLDLLFVPDPPRDVIDAACAAIAERQPFTLHLGEGGPMWIDHVRARTGWLAQDFRVQHHPALHLWIGGQGDEARRAVLLARAYGADVTLATPDHSLGEWALSQDVAVLKLHSANDEFELFADPYSAVLLLFHDHDWETELLVSALRRPAFYIGAMGSPATHRARLALLRERGIDEAELSRVSGPVGLLPGAREPATLALSALAEVVARYRQLIDGDG